MPVKTFVMLNVEVGGLSSVAKELQQIEPIKESHIISGDYDIIAIIEVDEISKMDELINNQIQNIKGVKKSTTYVALVG